MKNNQLKNPNSLLQKKVVNVNGKSYVNLVLTVCLNNGDVVDFEIAPKFYNRKFDFKLKQNISEVR